MDFAKENTLVTAVVLTLFYHYNLTASLSVRKVKVLLKRPRRRAQSGDMLSFFKTSIVG